MPIPSPRQPIGANGAPSSTRFFTHHGALPASQPAAAANPARPRLRPRTTTSTSTIRLQATAWTLVAEAAPASRPASNAAPVPQVEPSAIATAAKIPASARPSAAGSPATRASPGSAGTHPAANTAAQRGAPSLLANAPTAAPATTKLHQWRSAGARLIPAARGTDASSCASGGNAENRSSGWARMPPSSNACHGRPRWYTRAS
ncbi:MAG: hypothetical protein B7Z68_07970 [Acidobacteria bacterium 21-70-11]|nr:MAG: hypothetical protein B7Z68_07970 [Acidobacteria bacterium 21-70-11]